MEHRSDLQNLLMSGLPEVERRHVANAIREATAAELRQKRAQEQPLINGDESLRAEP